MRLLLLLLSAGVLSSLQGSQRVASAQAAPGFLDFDNLPETGFSCSGKVIGGYYADIETGCQMFHVCTVGQKGEVMDIKFLCLNGTVFDQETRVCERVDEVDCSKTEGFYNLNLELYGAQGFSVDEEDDEEVELDDRDIITISSPIPATTTSTTTTTTTTSRPPPTPAINFPSSSPGAVALLTLHNTFTNLQQPAANLQPPTPPTYTIRQQQHPHGVAHTYFSNTPRPFHPPFNFFGRSLSSPAPTVIATSRSVTSSVSVPVISHSPPQQHHTEHPVQHKYNVQNDHHANAHARQLITQREHAEKASVQQQEILAQQQEASAKADRNNKHVQHTQQLISQHQQQQQANAHAQHAQNLLVQQKREQVVAAQQQLVQQTATNQQLQDEEYDADYALDSFFRDVPKLQVARSSSVSISTSSSSSVAPSAVTQTSHSRTKRQSRGQRQRLTSNVDSEFDDTPAPTRATRPSRRGQQSFNNEDRIEEHSLVEPTEATQVTVSRSRASPRTHHIEAAKQERQRGPRRRLPTTRATFVNENNNGQYEVTEPQSEKSNQFRNSEPIVQHNGRSQQPRTSQRNVQQSERSEQLRTSRPNGQQSGRSEQFRTPRPNVQNSNRNDQLRTLPVTQAPHLSVEGEQSSLQEVFPITTPPPGIPVTSFTCANKIKGGFYADVEADCTVFHICSQGRHNRITDNKFLCGIGTRFDQHSRTCVAKDQVTCSESEGLYHLNDHFRPHYATQEEQDGAVFESKKVAFRRKRATRKGAPRYKLNTLPAESHNFECPEEDGSYADFASECQAYHQCNGNSQTLHICPHPNVFNEALGVCDAWENVDCELFSDGFYESHKTGRRKKRATNKKGAPRYKLNTLPEESRNFECPEEDGSYADFASECQAYHQCNGNSQTIHICPHPNVFNEALGVCDAWENVDCELFSDGFYESHKTGRRKKRATNKKGAPRYSLSTLPAESRDFKCPKEDGAYADISSDCQAYHQCNGNAHTLHICPHPSVFNEALGVCDSWENVDCELFLDAFYDSHKTKRTKRSASCDTADLAPGTPIPDFKHNCTKYHICVHSEFQGELTLLRLSCAPGKVMDAKRRKCVPGYECPSRMEKPRKNRKVYEKKDKYNKKKMIKKENYQSFEYKTTESTYTYNKNSKDIHSKNPSSKSIKASKFRRWLLTGPGAPSQKSLELNARIKRSTISELQKLQEFTRKNSNSSILTSVLSVKANGESKLIALKDVLKKQENKKVRVRRTSNPRYSRVKKPSLRAAILDADSESLEELLELRAALKRRKYDSEYEDYDEPPRRSNKRPHYAQQQARRRRPVVEYEDTSVEYDDYEPEQEAVEEEEIPESAPENEKKPLPQITEIMKPVPIAGTQLSELLRLANSQVNTDSKTVESNEAALNKLLASLLAPSVTMATTTTQIDLETTTTLPAPIQTTSKLPNVEEPVKVKEMSVTTEPLETSNTKTLSDEKEIKSHDLEEEELATKSQVNSGEENTSKSLVNHQEDTTEKEYEEITSQTPPSTTEKSATLRPYVIRRVPTPTPTTTLTPPVIRRMPIIRPPEQRSGKYSGVRKSSRSRFSTTTNPIIAEETVTKRTAPNRTGISHDLPISVRAKKIRNDNEPLKFDRRFYTHASAETTTVTSNKEAILRELPSSLVPSRKYKNNNEEHRRLYTTSAPDTTVAPNKYKILRDLPISTVPPRKYKNNNAEHRKMYTTATPDTTTINVTPTQNDAVYTLPSTSSLYDSEEHSINFTPDTTEMITSTTAKEVSSEELITETYELTSTEPQTTETVMVTMSAMNLPGKVTSLGSEELSSVDDKAETDESQVNDGSELWTTQESVTSASRDVTTESSFPVANVPSDDRSGEFLLLVTPRPEVATSPQSISTTKHDLLHVSTEAPVLDQEYDASYEYFDYSQEVSAEPTRKGSQELQESKKKLDLLTKSHKKESILHGYDPELSSELSEQPNVQQYELESRDFTAQSELDRMDTDIQAENSQSNLDQTDVKIEAEQQGASPQSNIDENKSNNQPELREVAPKSKDQELESETEAEQNAAKSNIDDLDHAAEVEGYSPYLEQTEYIQSGEHLDLELRPPLENSTNYYSSLEQNNSAEINADDATALFSCSGQPVFKFLADPTDTQVFHFCSPGLSAGQVLDFRFLCLEGRHFDIQMQKCV